MKCVRAYRLSRTISVCIAIDALEHVYQRAYWVLKRLLVYLIARCFTFITKAKMSSAYAIQVWDRRNTSVVFYGSLFCLFVYSRLGYFSAIQRLSPLLVTGLQISNQWLFFVPHLLRHGTSVYTVSFEGPAPMSHSGIRTGDARITRSLRLRSNHCATRAMRIRVRMGLLYEVEMAVYL
jgi:hypothetical protein